MKLPCNFAKNGLAGDRKNAFSIGKTLPVAAENGCSRVRSRSSADHVNVAHTCHGHLNFSMQ